jgi:hypothetical protein
VDQLRFRAAPDCGGVHCGHGILDAASALAFVFIVGNDMVPPETTCTWQAFVEGGLGVGPYEYEWSGVLSGPGNGTGTTNWISGVVAESGTLNVTVTATDGRQASDSFSVEVTSEVSECLERRR